MSDKIAEAIKEIAEKHGIAISRDDPILILQTLNERLMKDSAAAQQAMLDRFKEELEAISHRWSDDAKGKAERLLNAALAVARETMTDELRRASKTAASTLRREADASGSQLARMLNKARWVAWLTLIAAVITLTAVCVLAWVTRVG